MGNRLELAIWGFTQQIIARDAVCTDTVVRRLLPRDGDTGAVVVRCIDRLDMRRR